MYTTGILFGVMAGVTQVIGYALYNKEVWFGTNRPNTTTWLIWAISSLLSFTSYSEMTGDWGKNILPAACSISCIVTFLFCLSRGRFKKIGIGDGLIFGVDMIATSIWFFTGSPTIGNMAYQAGTITSFIPLARDVAKDPENEKPGAWYVWSLAYSFAVVAVCCRWEKWEDVVSPALCLVLHFTVAVLASSRRKLGKFAI